MSIEVKELCKNYGAQKAVNHLSFTAEKGQILGFLGPNGAGKTTTMKILSCYIKPDSGTAKICGFDILEQPLDVKRHIGYLPEHNPLYKEMYIREYLLILCRISKVKHPNHRINQLIELTGLGPEQHKTIGEISKGYKQRVGLCQALLHDPQVLILDEPTSGLDPNQLIEIRKLIRNIGKEKTLIFSTHIMQEVTSLCDRVLIIRNGTLAAHNSIQIVLDQLTDKQIVDIEFSQAIPIEKLKMISDVRTVSALGNNRYQITSDTKHDLREILFHHSVSQNWVIYEMNKSKNSLEDVFSSLTKQN